MPASARSSWFVLAALCLAVFLVVVDNTIVNVALPTLAARLAASNATLQWIVDAYTLPFAGLLLAGGELADRFGRRRVMQLGLVAFSLFSLAAAESHSVLALLLARAAMGASAAFIFPATLSILNATFVYSRERATAFGVWGATVGVAIATGPLVGGYLLDHFWYGSIFLVSVPIGLVAVGASLVLVTESRSPDVGSLDARGLLLGVLGVSSLTWGIIEGPTWGWHARSTVLVLAASAALLTVFIRFERGHPHPILDVHVFSNRRFSGSAIAIFVGFFCLFGFIFVVTQYFQFIRGYTPFSAGVHTLPFAVVTALAAPVATKVEARIGARWVVSFGLVTMGCALFWVSALSANSPYLGSVVLSMMLLALGFACISSPATATIMGTVRPGQVGVGAAVNETTRELGGTFGVAVVGSVFSTVFSTQIAGVLRSAGVAPGRIAEAQGSMLRAFAALGPERVRALHPAIVAAFMHGFEDTCRVVSIMTLGAGLAVFLLLPARSR
jgi:EmrB/QacA subfamily drug resistance transporter